jgi:predicted nucleic acid-binding protein
LTSAYLDASALVKLVLAEEESDALRRFMDVMEVHAVSCSIAGVEIVRAVRRAAPRLMPQASALLGELEVIAVTDAMLELAGRIDPPEMRTIDAIHLAAAWTIRDDLHSVVTYDLRMQAGAAELGLRVESPA